MQRDFFQDGTNGSANGRNGAQALDLDAVVIGGGFAGVYLLYRLRQEGFNVKLVEAGSALGGIWHWNTYPGARVDSPYPIYQLDIPEVYNTWSWSHRFPSGAQLREYFQHVDKTLDISKDALYNTRVNGAKWDDDNHHWTVTCDNGTVIRTRFLHCCLGFAAKRLFPDWKDLDKFEGLMCHSSFWPEEGVDPKGKKIAVVGTGATGIQIAQTMSRECEEMTAFVRTPNMCVPMYQEKFDQAFIEADRINMHDTLQRRYLDHAGFLYKQGLGTIEGTPDDEVERRLQAAWEVGGLGFLYPFTDGLTNEKSNRKMYDFWARKIRAKITDPVKREILAPLEPPHPIFGKRPSLQLDYYEAMDQEHVKLVDLKKTQVSHVVSNGIVTTDGVLHEADVIAFATGFDSMTGGFKQIDMRGIGNQSLSEYWDTDLGAISYLGMAVNKFPNMFYTYGPHAPTAYGNGPSTVQPQGDWIVDLMKSMRESGKTKIEAQHQAELEWKALTNKFHAATIRHNVDSWYTGTNIPGKPRQALNFAGGLPYYMATIKEKAQNGYEGFDLQ